MEAERLDPLLGPLVSAAGGAASEELLARLISEHAEPIVTRIVNYKMHSARRGGREEALAEAEDVRSEVMLQLIQRLQNFRADYVSRPIRDFHSYVAVTAYNAYDRYISRKYPQRLLLKNGLRYLLKHRQGFALWQTEQDVWVGGLHSWRTSALTGGERDENVETANRLQQLRDNPRIITRDARVEHGLSDPQRGMELLNAIFEWTGAPVELDLLTSVVAEWWGVTDVAVEINDAGDAQEEGLSRGVQLADDRPGVSVETERRVYLEHLWREIVALPPRQCAALLLNLRDEQGRGVVDLWMLTGIASAQTVAETLGMNVEEFAEMWNELPLDDNRIAAHLGLVRQQVINLRKSARERLARRMKGF